MDFPDHSAQEQIIDTQGNITLMRKRGQLVLRDGRQDVVREDVLPTYQLLEPTGKILEVGFGLGLFARWASSQPQVTSVTSVEISNDMITLVRRNYDDNVKQTIINDDIMTRIESVTASFDVILYDIPWSQTQTQWQRFVTFAQWARNHLEDNGCIIIGWTNKRQYESLQTAAASVGMVTSIIRHAGRTPIWIKITAGS